MIHHNKHHDKDSNTAVLDRPTAQDPEAEAKRLEHDREERREKEEAERMKRPSGKIYRFAADLIEDQTKRPRDVIEREVAMATSNEIQAALLRGIIAHLDGNLPDYKSTSVKHDKSDVIKS